MPRISTFGGFASEMRRLSEEKQRKVKELVELTLGDIEEQAIRDAPGPGDSIQTQTGRLQVSKIKEGQREGWTPISQAIGYYVSPDGFKGEVFVEKSAGEIAVWVEVGTGQSAAAYLATVPAEWREMAAQYIRTKRGTIVVKSYFLPAILRNEIEFKKGMDKIFR